MNNANTSKKKNGNSTNLLLSAERREHETKLRLTPKEKKLAKMWCQLNRWEWPKELEHKKPSWWMNPKDRSQKLTLSSPLMAMIEIMIGTNKCMEVWRSEH